MLEIHVKQRCVYLIKYTKSIKTTYETVHTSALHKSSASRTKGNTTHHVCVCVSVRMCVCVPRNGGDLLNLAALTNSSAWKIFWKCCKALCVASYCCDAQKVLKIAFPFCFFFRDDYIINPKRFCNTCASQTNNKQQKCCQNGGRNKRNISVSIF